MKKDFIEKHQELWKIIKFVFTSCSTAILEMLVFALLNYVIFRSMNDSAVTGNPVLEFLGIRYKGYMYSYFISAVIGYTASYIMNRKVTFHSDTNILLSTVLYVIMVAVTITFNTWSGGFLGSWLHDSGHENVATVMLTKLLVMLVPTLWTYPLQRFVIHKPRKTNIEADADKTSDEAKEETAV
ncbi:MAG: GtrA family protein [Clostridiales bacterium]|nr:GtrA family protein [Clostridiales bacterium]